MRAPCADASSAAASGSPQSGSTTSAGPSPPLASRSRAAALAAAEPDDLVGAVRACTLEPRLAPPAATTRAAPSTRAACTATRPTAPVAPSTSTVSPVRTGARHASGSQPARPAIPHAPASAGSAPSGTSVSSLLGDGDALGEPAVPREPDRPERPRDPAGRRIAADALAARDVRERRVAAVIAACADVHVERVERRRQHLEHDLAGARDGLRRLRDFGRRPDLSHERCAHVATLRHPVDESSHFRRVNQGQSLGLVPSGRLWANWHTFVPPDGRTGSRAAPRSPRRRRR